MFDNEIVINAFQLRMLARIATDLPESQLFEPGAGHGHPPVWILGHLAICGELGQKLLGGRISHPRWWVQFGPGSSDQVAEDASLTLESLVQANTEAYAQFRMMAAQADAQKLQVPHGAEILKGTGIDTIGQLISHLLTSHFAAHLSQLSCCRRAAGHKALF